MDETGGIERGFEPAEMKRGNGLVGDHEQRARSGERREMRAGPVDQPVADDDVIGALAEFDSQGLAHIAGCAVRSPARNASIAAATRAAVARGFSSVVSTTRSACA